MGAAPCALFDLWNEPDQVKRIRAHAASLSTQSRLWRSARGVWSNRTGRRNGISPPTSRRGLIRCRAATCERAQDLDNQGIPCPKTPSVGEDHPPQSTMPQIDGMSLLFAHLQSPQVTITPVEGRPQRRCVVKSSMTISLSPTKIWWVKRDKDSGICSTASIPSASSSPRRLSALGESALQQAAGSTTGPVSYLGSPIGMNPAVRAASLS